MNIDSTFHKILKLPEVADWTISTEVFPILQELDVTGFKRPIKQICDIFQRHTGVVVKWQLKKR